MTTTVQKSLHINGSPSEVWKALADFAAIAEWAPNCDHSSWASDVREGVGAVRRVQVGRVAILETINGDGEIVARRQTGHRERSVLRGLRHREKA